MRGHKQENRGMGYLVKWTVLGVWVLGVWALALVPPAVAKEATLAETVQWLKNKMKIHSNVEKLTFSSKVKPKYQQIKTYKDNTTYRLEAFKNCIMTVSEVTNTVENSELKYLKRKDDIPAGTIEEQRPATISKATGRATIPFGSLTFKVYKELESGERSQLDLSKKEDWSYGSIPSISITARGKIIKRDWRQEEEQHLYQWKKGVYREYRVRRMPETSFNGYFKAVYIKFNDVDVAVRAGKVLERLNKLCGSRK